MLTVNHLCKSCQTGGQDWPVLRDVSFVGKLSFYVVISLYIIEADHTGKGGQRWTQISC